VAPEADQQSADIREYLRPLRKRWWLIALIVIAVTAGTYLYYDRKPDVYSATSQLFVESSSLDQVLFGSSGGQTEETVENLSLLLQTTPVAEEVAKDVGFSVNPRALLGAISAQGESDSSFISVTANAASPEKAALLSNAFSQAFIDIRSRDIERQAADALEDARQQLDELGSDPLAELQRTDLLARIERLELIGSAGAGGAGIELVEPAVAPAEPIEPQPMQNATFAFVISLVLGIGAAFGLERLDRRMQRVEDVEDALGKPVLTELPRVETPAPIINREAVIAEMLREPVRRLQMNLEIVANESMLETIVVASAAPGEGKSIVARNLALAYREAGRHVALVDADFRKPSVGRLLGLDGEPGLANVLAGWIDFDEALQEVPGLGTRANGNGNGYGAPAPVGAAVQGEGFGTLAALTTGPEPANPAAALATVRMQDVIEEASGDYDTVLIDSPPMLAVSDVLPLLSVADGVILVTRIGMSTRESASRMLAELERVPDVNVIGVVVNGVPPRTHRNRAYGYGYYSAPGRGR
jgi:Mrp family chromosome partitioning ATPase/capsular polysaccharide biosynthesis protein